MKLTLLPGAIALLMTLTLVGCEAGEIEGDGAQGAGDPTTGTSPSDMPAELPKAEFPDVISEGCTEDAEGTPPGCDKLELRALLLFNAKKLARNGPPNGRGGAARGGR